MMSTETQPRSESHTTASANAGAAERVGKSDSRPGTGAAVAGLDWTRRYPERWRLELAALEATGWTFTASAEDDGTPVLEVDYPVPPDPPGSQDAAVRGEGRCAARLVVRFAAEAPFFPPSVFDPDNQLGLQRHRNPGTGHLCLIEEEDWRVDTTVAALLADQVPKLLRAGRGQTPPEPGVEVPGPEPAEAMLPRVANVALLVPDLPIPSGVDEGALVVRYSVRSGGVWLGTGIVEHLLAPGMDLGCLPGLPPLIQQAFGVIGYGRWARDPLFDPADTAAETYRRLQQRLQPLIVDADPADSPDAAQDSRRLPEITPAEMEVLLLLVPSERGHRTASEAWVAILRIPSHAETDAGSQGDGDEAAAGPGAGERDRGVGKDGDSEAGLCEYLRVQALGPGSTRTRTPDVARLADRHVVIVGVGALGAHVAEDLARSGIGRLDLVDGDHVEIATAARQHAPLFAAGRNKAQTLGAHLSINQPYLNVRAFPVDIGARPHRPLPHPRREHEPHRGQQPEQGREPERALARDRLRQLEQALRTADLVIDASAAPAVTRYLAALRNVHHRDFLHLSATAGAWGGVVFLATPGSGCWACLQHHRAEGTVAIPPADPSGIITAPGCAEPTFTGTNPDLATIAHHASRVAIQRLLTAPGHIADGDPVTDPALGSLGGLGGDLYVARLREDDGSPIPATWQSTPVLVHPDCPLHADAAARLSEPAAATPTADAVPATATAGATAQVWTTRTVGTQPPERTDTTPDEEADGHSPSGAPVPRTQQRKRTRIRHLHEAGQAGVQSEPEGGDRIRSRTPAPGPRTTTTAETGSKDCPPGPTLRTQTGRQTAAQDAPAGQRAAR